MDAGQRAGSVGARAARILAPFVAATLGWVFVSDLNPLRFGDPQRFARIQLAGDVAFALSIIYALYRTMRSALEASDAATRRHEVQLRAYELITACDTAAWSARNRAELLDAYCRLAVEVGGYRMVWAGLGLHDEQKTVRVLARAGFDDGYLDEAAVVWSDTPRGRGPTGTCIRTGTVQIARWTDRGDSMEPWREAALRGGYRCSASFPVRRGHPRAGALTLYSGRPDAFDAKETELMERVANSLTYALEHFDKVEAEAKLVEELKILAHAIDGSPVSVVITDKDGSIEFVNRKFCAITGYSAEEVRGRNPRLLKTGETSPDDYRRMWETISSGGEWRGVFHNRRKDGGTFWENSFISGVRDDAGVIRHYIAVKEDITEKRSLEAQLVQAQKMESLGALAGGVAHDFNNLLTVIQGHCELLAMSAGSSPGNEESVAEIRAAAERAAAMTRRLLQFSRRQPMHARTLDLRRLVWDEVRMLARLTGEEHALRYERPSEPLHAHADANMLGLVLMNLVLNARDAAKAGGAISVSLAAAPADGVLPAGVVPSSEGFVVLSVADHGCGIREGDLRRIFEPFFTTKPAGAGTGLGLSVVDGIVRQHKGWIEVDSALGRGSTFRVYLPRASEPAESDEPPESPPSVGGTEAVLLVEDDAPLRAVAARALRSAGYRVTEAADGAAALLVWERRPEPIDLLLSDMTMPGGMNGVELARRLRLDSPALRVLVISGHHRDLPTDSETIGDGFDFLPKPFVPDELTAAVRAALDRPAPPAR